MQENTTAIFDQARPPDLAEIVRREGIHFLDFGCSTGGSLRRYSSLYDGKATGLGLDMDVAKVNAARASGNRAVLFDINDLSASKVRVNFVSLSHFLEHLSGIKEASRAIQVACHISRHFVVINQPYFDADGLLLRAGLKPYWSDWSGHPNRMTSLEFHNILYPLVRKQSITAFHIYGRGRITSYDDDRLIPLETPTNSQRRPTPVSFPSVPRSDIHIDLADKISFPVYAETVVIIEKSNCPLPWLKAKLRPLDLIISSQITGRDLA